MENDAKILYNKHSESKGSQQEDLKAKYLQKPYVLFRSDGNEPQHNIEKPQQKF